MKDTIISIRGLFTKKQIAKILRFLWKIQKKVNPKFVKEKYFIIWVSNDEYSDEEVRKLVRENFKDIKVIDLVEKSKAVAG